MYPQMDWCRLEFWIDSPIRNCPLTSFLTPKFARELMKPWLTGIWILLQVSDFGHKNNITLLFDEFRKHTQHLSNSFIGTLVRLSCTLTMIQYSHSKHAFTSWRKPTLSLRNWSLGLVIAAELSWTVPLTAPPPFKWNFGAKESLQILCRFCFIGSWVVEVELIFPKCVCLENCVSWFAEHGRFWKLRANRTTLASTIFSSLRCSGESKRNSPSRESVFHDYAEAIILLKPNHLNDKFNQCMDVYLLLQQTDAWLRRRLSIGKRNYSATYFVQKSLIGRRSKPKKRQYLSISSSCSRTVNNQSSVI